MKKQPVLICLAFCALLTTFHKVHAQTPAEDSTARQILYFDSLKLAAYDRAMKVVDKLAHDTASRRYRRLESLAEDYAVKVATYTDTNYRFPRFIRFCLGAYRWVDGNLNSYDTAYVRPTGKHGKVRLVSDNWSDSYLFRLNDGASIQMASNPYSNLGMQANYSVLSLSFTRDIGHLFGTGRKGKHKKTGFTLYMAKIYLDAYYWRNKGNTRIRSFTDTEGNRHSHDLLYEGLNFKAYGAMAYYIFNGRKFSFPAAYNLSNYQRRTAGSWMAGLSANFYYCDFDLAKLPDAFDLDNKIPKVNYSMMHHAYTLSGGYSINVVLGHHWLFNATALPALGFAHSRISFDQGHTLHFTFGGRAMGSLSYFHRQFFATAVFAYTGNYFLTRDVGFMPGVMNLQVSSGVRF